MLQRNWKDFTNPALIHYYMPEGKEWEVLEYFAEYDVRLFKKIINYPIFNSPFSPKKFIEHYKNVDAQTLHPAIVNHLENLKRLVTGRSERGVVQAVRSRNFNDEKRTSFYNNKGRIIQFFKFADQTELFSVEDYFQISEIFMNSGLSIDEFCKKYSIHNVEGFKLAMQTIAYTDERFASFFETLQSNTKTINLNQGKQLIIDIVSNNTPIGEIINKNKTHHNLENLLTILNSLDDGQILIDPFLTNVISYYHSRLSSCDSSTNIENINKMLTTKEVEFIASEQHLQNIKLGKKADIAMALKRTIQPYKDSVKSISIERLFNNSENSLLSKLKPYGFGFNRLNYLRDNPQAIMPDGTFSPVTDEVIDMSEFYIRSHGIFECYHTIIRTNRAVLEGKIQNQADMKSCQNESNENAQTQISYGPS